MKLTRIEGHGTLETCLGCNRSAIVGTDPWVSAATGETRTPEEWYQKENGEAYCSQCAAKLVAEDPTRSRSQFFADTVGSDINPDVFHESV
jgi:hypothetical protein